MNKKRTISFPMYPVVVDGLGELHYPDFGTIVEICDGA